MFMDHISVYVGQTVIAALVGRRQVVVRQRGQGSEADAGMAEEVATGDQAMVFDEGGQRSEIIPP